MTERSRGMHGLDGRRVVYNHDGEMGTGIIRAATYDIAASEPTWMLLVELDVMVGATPPHIIRRLRAMPHAAVELVPEELQ